MLELRNISKTYQKRGPFGRILAEVKAVRDISLVLAPGKTIGVIGESGSGKSTLARIALRIIAPDDGTVWFDDADITEVTGRALHPFRHAVQPVFQDSAGALDPRLSIRRILSEPLVLRGLPAHPERLDASLSSVDLPRALLDRKPSELSGGQRQRIGIARALLMEPRVLVLDEPVSALDVSVQAQILNLLADLQDNQGLSYLFVGHDLSVAEFFCDEILVMYNGEAKEFGPAESVFRNPQDSYTRRLIASMPRTLEG